MAKKSNWLRLFEDFIKDIRIASKHVVSTDPRGVPLVLWESQRRFLHEVGTGLDNDIHQFNVLKSRQLGVTTVSLAIDVFWLAMHNNIIGCLVSDTEKNRDANRMLIELYVSSFEDGYFGEDFRITKSNRQFLQFSNGARLDLLVAGVKKKAIAWGQGQGYTFAHLTECGNYADGDGVASLEEGFAPDNPHSLYIFESTAKGMNHWRTRYMRGLDDLKQHSFFVGWWSAEVNKIERGDPRFAQFNYQMDYEEKTLCKAVLTQYKWKITPEQLAWYRWKQANAGNEHDLLEQNQPWTAEQAFVQTGYSFFQTRVIGKDLQKIADANAQGDDAYVFTGYRYHFGVDFYSFSIEKLSPQDIEAVELKIWEEPVPGAKYVLGFDPAYGRNEHKDGHAINVWRCFADRLVQVAEYLSRDVEVKHSAWVFFHLMAAYGDVMGNIDIGGPGRLVMAETEHLRQLLTAEMNQAKTKAKGWEDAFANARYYLYHKIDSPGPGYVANFETNWRTKWEIMHAMRGAYVSRELDIKSWYLLKEMEVVVVNDGIIGAPESQSEDCKDDRVFACALAIRAWQDWIRKEMIMLGQTYESVMALENGSTAPVTRSINNMVFRFLAGANVEPEPIEGPKWLRDRGLV
jgi:hypothetical protein